MNIVLLFTPTLTNENRHVYIRSLVVDGNFKADHVKQKNAADDVFLTNGQAFMTERKAYATHLEEAINLAPRYKQVSMSDGADCPF